MKTILTGDRPTGKLHLGHYIGSLKNRVLLQKDHNLNIIIANTQALTDYFDQPELVQHNIFQLVEDYLSCGINPENSCIFVQSEIKGLFELTHYFSNLVSLSRLQRNPTIKEELKNKKFSNNILTGFLCYPISQAADILAFKPDLVPVGIDQLPMIEQSNEIALKFNSTYKCNIFKECKPLLSNVSKLLGTDGASKASKSLNNAIYLSDDDEVLKNKINSMYTDPMHIKRNDAGNVKNNVVFHYLDAFCENIEYVNKLKTDYETDGVNLGDMEVKKILFDVLREFLKPIREKRNYINKNIIKDVIIEGNKKANKTVSSTLDEIYEIFYKNKEY